MPEKIYADYHPGNLFYAIISRNSNRPVKNLVPKNYQVIIYPDINLSARNTRTHTA